MILEINEKKKIWNYTMTLKLNNQCIKQKWRKKWNSLKLKTEKYNKIHWIHQKWYQKGSLQQSAPMSSRCKSVDAMCTTRQWFSIFLMVQPFNIVSHIVLTHPLTITLCLLILHNCNFAITMNHNVTSSVFQWS